MKEIDWANLSFGYMKTDYNVRINFRNGAWGELEVSSDEHLNLHMAATCLHYGQEAFEGLKAFRGKDGKVRIFRLEESSAGCTPTWALVFSVWKKTLPVCNLLVREF